MTLLSLLVPVSEGPEENSADGKTTLNSRLYTTVCRDDGSSSLSVSKHSEENKTACDSLIPHTEESRTNHGANARGR